MAIRMTGLASGLDTETIVKELMSAKSLKKTKLTQTKTKLEWKQDKWKELNTKLYDLYSDYVSKMRLSSTYNAKKASTSDETKASVTAGSSATNGSYTMQISEIASSQYVTSSKLNTTAKSTTLLKDLEDSSGVNDLVGKQISIQNGTKSINLQIKDTTTIADLTQAFRDAGLNASFDATQQRFFISEKESGASNTFSITTTQLTADELSARSSLENIIGYDKLSLANRNRVGQIYEELQNLGDPSAEGYSDKYDKLVTELTDITYAQKKETTTNAATAYLKGQLYTENYDDVYKETKASFYEKDEDGNFTGVNETYTNKFKSIYANLSAADKAGISEADYITQETDKLVNKAADSATITKINGLIGSDEATKERLEDIKLDGVTDLTGVSSDMITKFGITTVEGTSTYSTDTIKNSLTPLVQAYVNMDSHETAVTDGIEELGLSDVTGTETDGTSFGSGMAYIGAKDSKITLNGAELTSTSQTVSVNGLAIDLKGKTNGTSMTFTVSTDVDGIYNTVKDFLKEYNTMMKEMNTLYGASTAKGYEPLTDEEKESMTDDQIKLWEDKIKGSLLRNDTTLNGIVSSMRSAVAGSVDVDGKKYSLASFGIMTSYDYTEGGQLHIYGDSDDSVYATNNDKLKAAILDDPDTVTTALTSIFQNLYKSMSDKMASSKVSSALTFYNDKEMKSELEDYQDQIDDWTDRLEDMEDNYYSQFTSMETALAKLQSQQSSLSSLFGS